jgi:hypothetical protein
MKSDPATEKNGTPASPAVAFASSVLPHSEMQNNFSAELVSKRGEK